MMPRNNVLILVNCTLRYIYEDPIQNIQAILLKIGAFHNFRIFTTDSYFGDTEPYSNLEFNKWVEKADGYVFYSQGDKLNVFCLDSFFNTLFNMSVLLYMVGSIKSSVIASP